MGDDKLHLWGISKRKELDIEGEPVWVASPEYVIVRKLEYFREGRSEKHLKDIASILAVSPRSNRFRSTPGENKCIRP